MCQVKCTLTKDTVCIVRNEDKLTKKWRQPHLKRGRPNQKIAEYLAKKGRQPHPKTGSPLRWPAGLSRENMEDYGYIPGYIPLLSGIRIILVLG